METRRANEDQAALWNGVGGRGWVEAQQTLDRMLAPFEELLVEAVGARRPTNVLDVGCGTGSTTLAVARALGEKGRCVGIDISEPMVALARARAAEARSPATFVATDAQTYAFEPAAFDMLISRFGVMFFDNPVGAFANLRRAARKGADLRFVAWRSGAENPFMTTAERAAAPLLPELPPRRPDAPGQFAFADRSRVQTILERSGWGDIAIEAIDVTCTLPETDLMPYLSRLGPVGQALHSEDEAKRLQVATTVRAAFDPYVHGAEVRFAAACWMLGARAG